LVVERGKTSWFSRSLGLDEVFQERLSLDVLADLRLDAANCRASCDASLEGHESRERFPRTNGGN
jgi:hypothetical protein